jgi:predicted secreted protein
MSKFSNTFPMCGLPANRASSEGSSADEAPKPASHRLKSSRRFSAQFWLAKLSISRHSSSLWRHRMAALEMVGGVHSSRSSRSRSSILKTFRDFRRPVQKCTSDRSSSTLFEVLISTTVLRRSVLTRRRGRQIGSPLWLYVR